MKNSYFRPLLCGLTTIGMFAGFSPVASAGLTGTCGMLTSVPHLFMIGSGTMTGSVNTTAGTMSGSYTATAVQSGAGPYGVDVLAEINFTNSTVSYNVMQVGFPSGVETYTSNSGSVSFTTSAGPANLPGSSTITFTPTGSSTAMSLIVLPVNSGNTILIQGTTDSTHGVCQMM